MNTNSPFRGSKSLLLIIGLTLSSQLLQGEVGINVAQALQQQATTLQQAEMLGIFDRLEKKINEKEQALADFQVSHSKNLIKAQQQAALIAAGQIDGGEGSMGSIDEEIDANLDKMDKAPLKQLAGMKADNNKKKAGAMKQGLVQQGSKGQKKPEESDDEPRDDFEGFGSITAMVQNKDKLVEKTMADEQFQEDLKRKEQEEQAAIERVKREKEEAEKAAKAAKLKEKLAKKNKLTSAKAKLQAVLDKSIKKTQTLVVTPPKPAFKQVVSNEPLISQNAYQKAIQSVLKKPKPSVTQATRVEPKVIADLQSSERESEDEPAGFLGRFSRKISDQEMNTARLQDEMEQQQLQQKSSKITFSKSAPKHKGMLARAMEKDMQEQEQKEEKEKDALMQAAINDPSFQSHLNNLRGPAAVI